MTFPAGLRAAIRGRDHVFKNGGGAHLDLMTARYILGAVQSD
jgi:hypothetical protein